MKLSLSLLTVFLVLSTLMEGTVAFTTKNKVQERSKRPAFKGHTTSRDAPPQSHETVATAASSSEATTTPYAAFVSAGQAVQSFGYYHHPTEEEDDEELITTTTAVVACVLSLALGFGLGYGT
jgi:hypothetical protein